VASHISNAFSNQGNPEHQKEIDKYSDQILALALLFISKQITRAQYTQRHLELTETAIVAGIIIAGGVLTAAQSVNFLKEQLVIARESTRKLADDIQNGRYTATEERPDEMVRNQLLNRLALWTFTVGGAYVVGQRTRPPTLINFEDTIVELEPYYDWMFGETEDHCVDCLEFSQAGPQPQSYWERRPPPQSPDLACGGWRCDCWYREIPVDEVVEMLVSA